MSDRMREEIERLEAARRYVADNLVDAIWVMDVETLRYEYVTPSFERISGYTGQELRDLPIELWLTGDSQDQALVIFQTERARYERTGEAAIRELELECVHKDGHKYWTEIRAKFRKDNDGSLKILGVTRDITERKRLESGQQELITRLGEALAEKERLLKENNTLRGLLPICSGCRRIRDEENRWWPLEAYVQSRGKTKLTHTICPDCESVMYGDSDS